MAENLTPIKLDEMRPGLFRIHCTFFKIKKNLGIYTVEFQLCGSQSECKFKITYHVKSLGENNNSNYDYTVTIDEIPCNNDSSGSKLQPDQYHYFLLSLCQESRINIILHSGNASFHLWTRFIFVWSLDNLIAEHHPMYIADKTSGSGACDGVI